MNKLNGEPKHRLNTFMRKMKRRERRASEIADNMVACLGKRPDSYMKHMELPRLLGAKLMPKICDDMFYRNSFLEGISKLLRQL